MYYPRGEKGKYNNNNSNNNIFYLNRVILQGSWLVVYNIIHTEKIAVTKDPNNIIVPCLLCRKLFTFYCMKLYSNKAQYSGKKLVRFPFFENNWPDRSVHEYYFLSR